MARTLILFLLFLSAFRAQAQSDSLLMQQINDFSCEIISQMETAMMKDSLLLNDTQLTKVDSVNRNYFKGLASMSREGLNTEGRKLRAEGLSSSKMFLLEVILTAQQYQQYLVIIERRKQRNGIINN